MGTGFSGWKSMTIWESAPTTAVIRVTYQTYRIPIIHRRQIPEQPSDTDTSTGTEQPAEPETPSDDETVTDTDTSTEEEQPAEPETPSDDEIVTDTDTSTEAEQPAEPGDPVR